jgi:hypothetical protein
LPVAPEGPGPEFDVGDVTTFANGNLARAPDATVFNSPHVFGHMPQSVNDGIFGPNGILFSMGQRFQFPREHVPYTPPPNPPVSGEVYVGIYWTGGSQTIREVAVGRESPDHRFSDRANCEYTFQYTTDVFTPVSCVEDSVQSAHPCDDAANVAVNWITIGHAADHLSEPEVTPGVPPTLRGARRRYVFPADITNVRAVRIKSVEFNSFDEFEIGAFAGALDLSRPAETVCDDRVDGDGDGDADCADSDCSAEPSCTAELSCTNGHDDDGDGNTDCDDSDCPDCLCNGPGLTLVGVGPRDERDDVPPGTLFDVPTFAQGNLSRAPDAFPFNSPHGGPGQALSHNDGMYGFGFTFFDPTPHTSGEKYIGIYWNDGPRTIREVAVSSNNKDYTDSRFADGAYTFSYTTDTFTPRRCGSGNSPCDDAANVFPQVTWCALGVADEHLCEPRDTGEEGTRVARRRYTLPADIPGVTAVRVNVEDHYRNVIDELEILGPVVLEEGGQLAGDCNQDGEFDLSDVICLLGHLFQGNPETLPCTSTPANLALMDCNGDGSVDLSDAVFKLAFLFQGGPPPEGGVACVGIPECPQSPGCP